MLSYREILAFSFRFPVTLVFVSLLQKPSWASSGVHSEQHPCSWGQGALCSPSLLPAPRRNSVMVLTSGSMWPVLAAAPRLLGRLTSSVQGVMWASRPKAHHQGMGGGSWHLKAMSGHSGMPVSPKKFPCLPRRK